MLERPMNSEFERMLTESLGFVEGLKKTAVNFCQDNQSPGRNLETACPGYEAGLQPTLPWRFIPNEEAGHWSKPCTRNAVAFQLRYKTNSGETRYSPCAQWEAYAELFITAYRMPEDRNGTEALDAFPACTVLYPVVSGISRVHMQ
jgi:hypothetical protein